MDGVELPPTRMPDRLGLAAAGRAAALVSREIAFADPDPLTLTELDDRLHRYATTLLSATRPALLGPIIGDWRRVQAILGRRLSPAVHAELTRVAGYLSFYLGMLAIEAGDDVTARRFATLTEQFAGQIDDRLLTGTSHSLDAAIAFVCGRLDSAATAAARAVAVDHPYLHGWAVAIQITAAAAAGDEASVDAALARLRNRPPVQQLRYPGWPAFDEAREACIVADAMARLKVPGAQAAAKRAIALAAPGSMERGWALAATAACHAESDPVTAHAALDEIVRILDRRPSRLLSTRLSEVILIIGSHETAGRAARPAGAA